MTERADQTTPEQVEASLPSAERRARGPYPLFECFQSIPCNPCATVCPEGVVGAFEDINELPRIDEQAECTACARCVAICPGLSCFLIDETYGESEATVTLAHEYLPLPEDGEEVETLDRDGEPVGRGRVVRVRNRKRPERTPLVTLAVPKADILRVRAFRALPGGAR